MVQALALILVASLGADEVVEPRTEKAFPATLESVEGPLICTGTTLRTKWTYKVYAIGHYGPASQTPASDDPAARRMHWIEADSAKAFVLRFCMEVDGEKMRKATAEAFDRVGYEGAARADFLKTMDIPYPDDSTLEILAATGGKVTAKLDGKKLGTWEDAGLVRALWSTWLDKKSVLNDPDKMVAGYGGTAFQADVVNGTQAPEYEAW